MLKIYKNCLAGKLLKMFIQNITMYKTHLYNFIEVSLF